MVSLWLGKRQGNNLTRLRSNLVRLFGDQSKGFLWVPVCWDSFSHLVAQSMFCFWRSPVSFSFHGIPSQEKGSFECPSSNHSHIYHGNTQSVTPLQIAASHGPKGCVYLPQLYTKYSQLQWDDCFIYFKSRHLQFSREIQSLDFLSCTYEEIQSPGKRLSPFLIPVLGLEVTQDVPCNFHDPLVSR